MSQGGQHDPRKRTPQDAGADGCRPGGDETLRGGSQEGKQTPTTGLGEGDLLPLRHSVDQPVQRWIEGVLEDLNNAQTRAEYLIDRLDEGDPFASLLIAQMQREISEALDEALDIYGAILRARKDV